LIESHIKDCRVGAYGETLEETNKSWENSNWKSPLIEVLMGKSPMKMRFSTFHGKNRLEIMW
jgi:hypothetical protein